MTQWIYLCVGALLLAQSVFADQGSEKKRVSDPDPYLVRGINIGNALEAPSEGDWGVVVQEADLKEIAAAGFDFIRLPVEWGGKTGPAPNYAISPQWMRRVKRVVDWGVKYRLRVVLNVHHYREARQGDEDAILKLANIWRQVGGEFRGYDNDQVIFELLNEPTGRLTPPLWNSWIPVLLKNIREENPQRAVILSGAISGGIEGLERLTIPHDDNLILSFHYYAPMSFTHQGAPWNPNGKSWQGSQWLGRPSEINKINDDFDRVSALASNLGVRRVILGEFGAYKAADVDSRVAWTCAVRSAAERRGFAWAYWEFRAGFGVFNFDSGRWNQSLLQALMNRSCR